MENIQENDKIFWTNKTRDEITSQDIEVAAYNLLTYMKIGTNFRSKSQMANWLISQQNSNGGFKSTQDTIIALQALSEYARIKDLENTTANMEVFDFSDFESFTFRVTDENKFKLQTQMLPKGQNKGLEVNVAVNGEGCALTQFISR